MFGTQKTGNFLAYLAAGALVLLALPGFLEALKSLRAAAVASAGVALVLLLWSQRERVHPKVFPWLPTLGVFGTVVLAWNAERIKHLRNIGELLLPADSVSWSTGHTLGAALGTAVLLVLWDFTPSLNREKILSGPRLIPMASAQKKASANLKPDERTIFWGGINIPEHCGTEHFAIVGTPGSGKSLSFQLLMKDVLRRMAKGSDRRAIIYDAKRDTVPFLAGLFKGGPEAPPCYILNPFDARSSPWDLGRDIREGASALQFASILIPPVAGESQPYFRNASRLLLAGVIEAFIRLAPGKWTLRDIILTLRHEYRMVAILSTQVSTAPLIDKYLNSSKQGNDVVSTLDTFLGGLPFVAAAWHHSDQPPISLKDWASSEAILVLGSDPKFDFILQLLNRAIFKRAVEIIRTQPDVKKDEKRQTWFFIDELRNAGNLEDLDKLLVEGRSKGACVTIGFQDLAGLREVFGDKRANEIIGACANKAFLQNGEGSTIDYASKHFKSQEILETRRSETRAEKNSTSYSQQRFTRPVVHEGHLKSLPKPERGAMGLNGYCDTSAVGTLFPYRMELSAGFLDAELPHPVENVPGFIARLPAHLDLPDWDKTDLTRLGIIAFSNLIRNEKPSQSSPAESSLESGNGKPDEGKDHDIFGIG